MLCEVKKRQASERTLANAWPSLLLQQLDRSLLKHIDLYGVVCTVSFIFTLQVQTYELISTFDV